MLEKVKLLLGITDNSKNDLLTFLIEQAIEEVMAYTHLECVDELIPQSLRLLYIIIIALAQRGQVVKDIAVLVSTIPKITLLLLFVR